MKTIALTRFRIKNALALLESNVQIVEKTLVEFSHVSNNKYEYEQLGILCKTIDEEYVIIGADFNTAGNFIRIDENGYPFPKFFEENLMFSGVVYKVSNIKYFINGNEYLTYLLLTDNEDVFRLVSASKVLMTEKVYLDDQELIKKYKNV
jgi:hypothetical protein